MAACLGSLLFVNISSILRSVATLMLEDDVSDKGGELWVKTNIFYSPRQKISDSWPTSAPR
jgi:hypothetical protein